MIVEQRHKRQGWNRGRVRVRRASPGLRAWLALGALACVGLGVWGQQANGQAEVRNPTQPLLVLNTEGHQGPVRTLAFAPEGNQLLSGGMDKVVRVWNLDRDDPGLARVIRPPIWRDRAGEIYAMALAPEPIEEGQRLLALAGFGVLSTRGEIMLYRYPGADPGSTGEPLAQLPAGTADDPQSPGHWNSVSALAFDPRGGVLASANLDGTVRLWDIAERRTLAVLRGHGGQAVLKLAFSPEGTRLFTGGADGSVVLWDTDRRVELSRVTPQPVSPVSAMAVSADGRWVVVGQSNGHLLRFDANDLGNEREFQTKLGEQGGILAVAFSPEGNRLATSILSARDTLDALPRTGCDIELWDVNAMLPTNRIGPARLWDTSDTLVLALAFGPDGRSLAYTKGNTQGIVVADLEAARAEALRFEGQGRGVWDVGFAPDSQRLGFSWVRPDRPNAPQRYWGFDLRERRVLGIPRDELQRGLTTYQGSTIRPIHPRQLQVEDEQGGRVSLDLNERDGRWWSYSFVPPGPGHERLTLAVGTTSSIILFARQPDGTYRRTRVLAGHLGEVFALAPSPDGRWLVSGSNDQTVRLWPLAGCDTRPAFGATFDPDVEGRVVVNAVEPGSYASAMDLRVGDVIEQFYADGAEREPEQAGALSDQAAPEIRLEFRVRRDEEVLEIGNTKRDNPALSLFVAEDREWVLWMPQSFYETSIAGDRRFLGWHRNGSRDDGAILDLEAPTDFFTIDRFEEEFRRPEVLNVLLDTADRDQALALVPEELRDAPQVVLDDAPPRIEIEVEDRPATGRLVIDGSELRFLVRAMTDNIGEARKAVHSVRLLVDNHVQQIIQPDAPEVDLVAALTMTPGVHRVSVVTNSERNGDRGRERIETFEVEFRPVVEVPPPARKARLAVLAIGVEEFGNHSYLTIPFAVNDARDLSAFLTNRTNHGFEQVDEPIVLNGAEATAEAIRGAFEQLEQRRERGELGVGDTLIVHIETHVLNHNGKLHLAPTDAGRQAPLQPLIDASEVADGLQRLSEYGCRVLVLLDGQHPIDNPPEGWDCQPKEWVRDLERRQIITFLASLEQPGEAYFPGGHRAFAEGILTSLDAGSQTRMARDQNRAVTLEQFRDAVETNVLRLTSNRQTARCYIPRTIPRQATIFDPPERAVFARVEALDNSDD